jgi:hypothetical protein
MSTFGTCYIYSSLGSVKPAPPSKITLKYLFGAIKHDMAGEQALHSQKVEVHLGEAVAGSKKAAEESFPQVPQRFIPRKDMS